jgi:hypothetical protein
MTIARVRIGLALAVVAMGPSCELSPVAAKNRCVSQADCENGRVCQGGICQASHPVPGLLSAEPFTGTELLLVTVAAAGRYQVVLQYDAVAEASIGVTVGSSSSSHSSITGNGLSFWSGPLELVAGSDVLGIGAGPGVTVKAVTMQVWPEGTVCGDTGRGYYCANNNMISAVQGTLYHCSGSYRLPDLAIPCPGERCDVEPPGVRDTCDDASVVPRCEAGVKGWYCGKDSMSNARADTLYFCDGAAGVPPDVITDCPLGCQVNASGMDDSCKS